MYRAACHTHQNKTDTARRQNRTIGVMLPDYKNTNHPCQCSCKHNDLPKFFFYAGSSSRVKQKAQHAGSQHIALGRHHLFRSGNQCHHIIKLIFDPQKNKIEKSKGQHQHPSI